MKRGAIALLLSSAALCGAAKPDWHELETSDYTFEKYCSDFGKTYSNKAEHEKRAAIFASALLKIKAHNAGESTWKMGISQFTDVQTHEMNMGFDKALSRDYNSRHSMIIKDQPTAQEIAALPASIDWRISTRADIPQVVTAVKDQGNCGSCWAFGSTATLESHVALNTKQLMVLSPQHLVSCSKNPQHCGGTGGCEGSIPELAFDFVKENGLSTEWTYPYESNSPPYGTGTCRNKTAYKPVVTVSGFEKLTPNNYDAVMHALATVGPLAINVQANVWQHYETGVFTGCSNLTNIDIDHVVSLVGYGTDPDFGDYFLVRNSWNTVWGEAGYIRLKRSATPTCGVDPTPMDGTGCSGSTEQHVCGECGMLFDVSYPTGAKLL